MTIGLDSILVKPKTPAARLSAKRDRFILANVGKMPIILMAKELGIATASVDKRMQKLGLKSLEAKRARLEEIKTRFDEFLNYYGYDFEDVSRALRLRTCPSTRKHNEQKQTS